MQQQNVDDPPPTIGSSIVFRSSGSEEVHALKILKSGRHLLFNFLFAIIPYEAETLNPQQDVAHLEVGGQQATRGLVIAAIGINLPTIILTYGFGWVIGFSFMPEETKLKRVWLYNGITATVTLTLACIVVAYLISAKYPKDAHALVVVGVSCGVLSFFMAASLALGIVVWLIFVIIVAAIIANNRL